MAAVEVSEARAPRTALLPLSLVVSLFFLWGVANNLNDILIRQFKKAFELTDFQSGLVQSAFYLGYFFLALPAGLFMRRQGYKGGIVLGLLLYGAGCFLFYPAAQVRAYPLFLLALFVIASGLAFLETAANPFVTVLGPAETATRRLNLAQAFNPLGSITGVFVGRMFIFSGIERTPEQLAAMPVAARSAYFAAESSAVQTPYLIIGAVVSILALVIGVTRFPTPVLEPDESSHRPQGQIRELAARRQYVLAVVAQFFYVGAQVGIWSYLIRYAQGTMPGTRETTAADYLIVSLVVFTIGRFAGAALMRYLDPRRVLAGYAFINTLLAAVAVWAPGLIGLCALIASSFFMSVMFPTIFAVGIRGLGASRKLGSSVLVMAIIGGALLTPLMGAISGYGGINYAMAVPCACFLVVLYFATLGTER
jgi:FHS family L-fucose permease-like MFS transporter